MWSGEDSWESLGQQGDQTSQSWIFIERTDDETEALILWPTDAKSQLAGKDPEAGKDWGKEKKDVTQDEMVDGTMNSMDMSLSNIWEMVKDREA